MKTLLYLCFVLACGGLLFQFLANITFPCQNICLVTKNAPVDNYTDLIIQNGPPLKHARVKEIIDNSIIFVCKRGVVQVPFDDLPPNIIVKNF